MVRNTLPLTPTPQPPKPPQPARPPIHRQGAASLGLGAGLDHGHSGGGLLALQGTRLVHGLPALLAAGHALLGLLSVGGLDGCLRHLVLQGVHGHLRPGGGKRLGKWGQQVDKPSG